MAPGALSILAPFLGRKSNKKYEKLQADDPEKRRQEATQEEINRLNTKIEKLVTSMSREDIDLVVNSEDACVVCCKSRAIMQVSPCGHQSLCRLCFVHNIREAVANRNLPLRCLICNAKIARVKNNRSGNGTGPEHPVHVKGQTTKQLSPPASLKGSNILRNQSQSKNMPTSVSGYSLCATQGDFIDEENDDPLNESTNNNYVQDQLTAFTNSTRQQKLRQSVIYNQKNELKYSDNQNQIGSGSTINSRAAGMAMSASNYSMSSALSSMSSSSFESQRSIRSSASLQSAASYRSVASNSSWFSIGSFSNFQAGGIMDPKAMNRAPRAHSLSSRGKLRGKGFISSSPSTHSVKSWNGPQTNSGSQPLTKSEALNNRRNLAASFSSSSFRSNQQLNQPTIRPSMSLNDVPLSPNSIDERIRAIQNTILSTRSNSEKNISSIGAQSPPTSNSSKTSTIGTRIGFANDLSTREPSIRSTAIPSSIPNVIGIKNIQNSKLGKENQNSYSSISVASPNGLANLNYNPDLPQQTQKQDSSVNRVSHGSITLGRESFRQGRANNGLITKMNNSSIETGTSVGSGHDVTDPNVQTSLNIDKFSHSSKGQMRRLSGNGCNEKHSFRKDSTPGYSRVRFAKSPEQMETTYSMTTIEEEQENVSVALSLRNLSQLDDNNSIESFNECSDD